MRKKGRTAQSLRAKPIRSTNEWFHSGCRKSTIPAVATVPSAIPEVMASVKTGLETIPPRLKP